MTHTRALIGTEIVFYPDPVKGPSTVVVMHDQDYVDIVLEAARQIYRGHDRKVAAIKFVRKNLVPRDGAFNTDLLSLFDAKCIVEDL